MKQHVVARVALVGLAAVVGVGVAAARSGEDGDSGGRPSGAAVGQAGGGVSGQPPPLPILAPNAPRIDADAWLNTRSATAPELTGRVALYEFWTFGCVNCRNVLPHVKAWHERYAEDGLVVLSIHTPEFGYEADPAAVADFVAENGISYPVALDPDKRIWRSFENHYWPAFYLHDRDGRRRLVHFGEGRYQETEDAIRALLGVDPSSPRSQVAS